LAKGLFLDVRAQRKHTEQKFQIAFVCASQLRIENFETKIFNYQCKLQKQNIVNQNQQNDIILACCGWWK